MAGLSDKWQAIIMLLALAFISVGLIDLSQPQFAGLASPIKEEIGIALLIIGLIGAALKELAGILWPTPAVTNPNASAPAARILKWRITLYLTPHYFMRQP